MAEKHDRCRYWPRCVVHAGLSRPRTFTEQDVAEMRELRATGEGLTAIAREFETTIQTVWRIVGRTDREAVRRREERAPGETR